MMKNLSRFFLQRSDKQTNNQGVTLIELLVVVVIITILSAIALPSFVKVAKGKVECYSGTGHCYEFVSRQWTWTKAKVMAEIRSYKGSRGYLATITSQGEQDFIVSNFTTTSWGGWIGATDAGEEGVWQWVTGPETGTVFWNNGEEIGYNNFATNQPNDFYGQEDYAHLGYFIENAWNDIINDTSGIKNEDHQVVGYYVEYGD
ncbi:MAG: prepilin-type N-terminal cleavage/methylation domain-containing protein [Okeania sp. SIO2C9]|uniref:prepilin-type N-terminal cleavage/methylation domain-containing protein n=1 Tax=Okeania sp. SIO2C9 TaxID=2607791 RepID=UPI0013C1DC88|nr:prepilin-type N-terminal cleavage/methylation domain-containing protein [Okeania sp. SIO2C9]NEQ74375.1 prepilin-type N-terminal cleavage/methylation domain-containing protein [Okeania sp. SIO2C9]